MSKSIKASLEQTALSRGTVTMHAITMNGDDVSDQHFLTPLRGGGRAG